MTIKILVEVSGGVAEVYSNKPDVELIFIDWDNIEGGETELVEIGTPADITNHEIQKKINEANEAIQENIDFYEDQN